MTLSPSQSRALSMARFFLLLLVVTGLSAAGLDDSLGTEVGNEMKNAAGIGGGIIIGAIWLCAVIGIGIIFATNSMQFNVKTISMALGCLIAAGVGTIVVKALAGKVGYTKAAAIERAMPAVARQDAFVLVYPSGT